jgi:erythromycin esterase-like protein
VVAEAAEPLPDVGDPAFAAAFDRFADKRVVMLGEASHGTHEFYAARAAITRRFVERHGFTIIAVEADWPDAAAIDRYIGHAPPRRDSYERVCHDASAAGAGPRFLLGLAASDPALRRRLAEPLLERYIGVIYRPETELWSHYSESRLPDQFDAWVWFDETRALEPLDAQQPHGGVPETYPFGL